MPANLARSGFWPVGDSNDAAIQTKRVRIASNNATAIYWGDCVSRTAAGVWGLATAGAGVGAVCQGGSIYDPSTYVRKEVTFIPAATVYTGTSFDLYGETDNSFLYITSDPPSVRYECQYSASTPALTDMTKNANFIATAGSAITGISGHALNQATLGTSNALDFAIMDLKRNVNNDPTLVSSKVIVQINVSVLPGSAGATGQ